MKHNPNNSVLIMAGGTGGHILPMPLDIAVNAIHRVTIWAPPIVTATWLAPVRGQKGSGSQISRRTKKRASVTGHTRS